MCLCTGTRLWAPWIGPSAAPKPSAVGWIGLERRAHLDQAGARWGFTRWAATSRKPAALQQTGFRSGCWLVGHVLEQFADLDVECAAELGFGRERELSRIEAVAEVISASDEALTDGKTRPISEVEVTATDTATMSEAMTISSELSHEKFRSSPEQFVLFSLVDLLTLELRFIGSTTLPDGTRITAPGGRRLMSRADAIELIMKEIRPSPGPFTIHVVKKAVGRMFHLMIDGRRYGALDRAQ